MGTRNEVPDVLPRERKLVMVTCSNVGKIGVDGKVEGHEAAQKEKPVPT